MRFVCPGLPALFLLAALSLRAQSSVPVLIEPLPAPINIGPNGMTLDLRNYFAVPGTSGTQFVQFNTVFGKFNVELRNDVAPRHVANFMAYVDAARYDNTFIHRATSFDNTSKSIVQGGGYGYTLPFQPVQIAKFGPIALEYNLANARGTLAAARTTDVNSATSEWYFNVRDNSTILNTSNGGGYSVFGRVMGTGMTVVDAIAGVPTYPVGGAFSELPLRNLAGSTFNESNLVGVISIRPVTVFPTSTLPSIVTFAVQSSNPEIVTGTISGSSLRIAPVGAGSAQLFVRATDTNDNSVTLSLTATFLESNEGPVFTSHPRSQTVATGSTVVLSAPATAGSSYRWERNGTPVAGIASDTLVLSSATTAVAGSYVAIATNSVGSTRSNAATVTVADLPAVDIGRLVNLSILTSVGTGPKVLTMGASVGGAGSAGSLPLVIRAVGPTLGQAPFNVAGVLPDPVMNFFAAGNSTPLETNDNWGGGAALASAFASVGAFALPAASLDSAVVRASPGVTSGGYTVRVEGKGAASGMCIAEMYDAAGAARTPTTPRLINLSTLAQIDAGTDLAVGFVIGGQSARTMLVRGVGPSLSAFNLTGLMADPRLELFDNSTGQSIAVNNDWAGRAEIVSVANAVGAFALAGATSKDAVLLVTLPPGQYSARIRGADNAGGVAIVEVYEVP